MVRMVNRQLYPLPHLPLITITYITHFHTLQTSSKDLARSCVLFFTTQIIFLSSLWLDFAVVGYLDFGAEVSVPNPLGCVIYVNLLKKELLSFRQFEMKFGHSLFNDNIEQFKTKKFYSMK